MAASTLSFVRTDSSEAMPPPLLVRGPIAWMRANLFSSIGNTILTLLFLALLVWIVPRWSGS